MTEAGFLILFRMNCLADKVYQIKDAGLYEV